MPPVQLHKSRCSGLAPQVHEPEFSDYMDHSAARNMSRLSALHGGSAAHASVILR